LYAFFVGMTAIVLGASVAHFGLTLMPPLTAVGYISAGAGAVLASIALWAPRIRAIRRASAILLALSALTWMATVVPAYWAHMKMLSGNA
jgi:putative membrane protein